VLFIELYGRLNTIADMVRKCELLCDVGTDHGYIPIYLVEKGVVQRAVASDVRPGPIAIARNNILQNGFENKIDARLGDGLKTVKVGECDCAVIAGMGGVLIREIIKASFDTCTKMKQIVLQPMNSQEELREYLYNNGFDILNERLVQEDKKLYIVMSVVYTGVRKEVPEINFYIGERLIANRDPLLPVYLDKQIKTCNKILGEMSNINNDDRGARRKQEWLKAGYERILKVVI
jgi:tRNA (adenine22-N1)-methyltransferase